MPRHACLFDKNTARLTEFPRCSPTAQPSGTCFRHISAHHPLVVDSLELGWKPISSHRPMKTWELLLRVHYFTFVYVTYWLMVGNLSVRYEISGQLWHSVVVKEFLQQVNVTSHSRWPCFSSGRCTCLECIAFVGQNIVDILGISSPAENTAIQGILWRPDIIALSICKFLQLFVQCPCSILFVMVSL